MDTNNRKVEKVPISLGLEFISQGDDVTLVSLHTSFPFQRADALTLLESVLTNILPDDFVYRFTHGGSAIVFGSDTMAATPLSCYRSSGNKVFELIPVSLAMEIPDGSVRSVTIDLGKVDGIRGDYFVGDRRFVRFSGVVSVAMEDETAE